MIRSVCRAAYRAAVSRAPLGLERRWRARMVEDFEARLAEGSGALRALLVTAGALFDLTGQSLARGWPTSRGKRSAGGPRRDGNGTRGGNTMESIAQDLRYALRGIRRRPGFALIVVLTLTLGIGANTTLFSVVNGVLLSPLPYPDSEDLYRITVHYADASRDANSSYPDFVDTREELAPLASVAAWHYWRPTMTAEGAEPRRLRGVVITEGWFDVMGLEASRGRFFDTAESTSGVADHLVIGHGLWTSAFGSDPDVVGRTLELNGRTRTIVGVGPAEYPNELPGIGRADLWVPTEYEGAAAEELPSRSSHNLRTVVRLDEGTDAEAVEEALDALMARLREVHPETNEGKGADLESMHELLVADAATGLKVLMGGVFVVLLIAVANVTSVLLGRAADREQEMALRSALGADRSRLYGQMVVESVFLAALGGAGGMALAYWGTDALVRWGARSIPLSGAAEVDATVLVVSTLATLGAGLTMGLVPAWWSGRVAPQTALRDGGGGRGTSGRRKLDMRGALVVAQVAMSLSLLTGAGLLVRSFSKLSDVDAGMANPVLSFGLHLPEARYPEAADREAFHEELEERLERIPGLGEVAAIGGMPMSGTAICGTLYDEADPERFAGGDTCAQVRSVSGDYFEVMGIPLLEGRTVNSMDNDDTDDVIVVNEAVADLLWPDGDPIGQSIMTGFRGRFFRVVGVVGNTKQFSLDESITYQTYISDRQWARAAMNLVIGFDGDVDVDVVMPAVREAVWAMDDQLPLYNVTTMAELRAGTLAEQRFRTTLIAGMALLALLISVVGIYGVISYSVSQRQREMAIRMSIGAERDSVRRMIVGQALRLVALGLAIGAVGGYAFGRALEALLYDVGRMDPVTLTVVPLVIVVAAVLAALIPAGRATRVDPMTALRE